MTDDDPSDRETAFRQWCDRVLTVLILATFVIVLLTYPDACDGTAEASAAFKPAPARIVSRARRGQPMPRSGTVAKRAWIICRVWKGPPLRCRRALNIAWCESGISPRAANGQHLGIFQMSADNRRRYGHSGNPWKQARAARDLWNDRHWSPWSCRPSR